MANDDKKTPVDTGNIFWRKVDTPDSANEAAKETSITYGILAFSYVITLLMLSFNAPLPFAADEDQTTLVIGSAMCLVVAAFLCWRTRSRPSLTLCIFALLWVTYEIYYKIQNTPNFNIGSAWLQFIALIIAINGIRGVLAQRTYLDKTSNGKTQNLKQLRVLNVIFWLCVWLGAATWAGSFDDPARLLGNAIFPIIFASIVHYHLTTKLKEINLSASSEGEAVKLAVPELSEPEQPTNS